jgi:hypothetical protein
MNLFYSTRAEEDVNIDSDEEPDFDKMDLVIFSIFFLFFKLRFLFYFKGSKKGPVGRWDFDTNEEYSSYMSNKEALPKYKTFIIRGGVFILPFFLFF